jgi:hypothetical protein
MIGRELDSGRRAALETTSMIGRLTTQIWDDQDGVLSFEWTLIFTLLVIGIVSGLAGARDAFIDELGDIAQAALSFDQSYSFPGVPELGIGGSDFDDDSDPLDPDVYDDCDRSSP